MALSEITRLTVLADLGMRQHGFSGRARRMLRCRCKCGRTVTVRKDKYESGATLSCGCLNRERVGAAARGRNRSKIKIGETYEHLTVIERLPNGRRGEAVYRCRCVCGNFSKVRGQSFSGRKKIRRCKKCGYADHLSKIHAISAKPSGEAACWAAYCQGRSSNAKSRGIAWEISFEDWVILSQRACHYCGSPPSNLSRGGYGRNGDYSYNGLDRVDNDVGYVLKNVVPCCKSCNHAKSDLRVEDFLLLVNKIAAKHPMTI